MNRSICIYLFNRSSSTQAGLGGLEGFIELLGAGMSGSVQDCQTSSTCRKKSSKIYLFLFGHIDHKSP